DEQEQIRQVHNTESHKYEDEREHSTKSHKYRDERDQATTDKRIQTDLTDRQQIQTNNIFRQTTYSYKPEQIPRCRQTSQTIFDAEQARQYSMQNKAKPDETRRIQSQMQPT
ncbi:hypothetical protein Tco_0504129, partial [Tanacetum coccineum]